jgi:RNA polymerase sigma factor (sigma-70 family)
MALTALRADATHEVFLRAANSLSEAPDSAQARAWLTKVARNYAIDLLRRRDRFGSAMTTLAATADAADESTDTVEDRQLLLAALLQMDARDRQALWQSAVEQRPVAAISRSFGLTYVAAAQLLPCPPPRTSPATRLAVIPGLAQLGQAARRSNLAERSQQLAAFVAVPLVIVAVVASSSPQPPIAATASAQAPGLSPGASVGHRAPVVTIPAPGGSTVPATGAVAMVVSVQAAPIPVAPASVVVPKPPSPVPSDLDKDHGKGRDRDDMLHTPPGKALGHYK